MIPFTFFIVNLETVKVARNYKKTQKVATDIFVFSLPREYNQWD